MSFQLDIIIPLARNYASINFHTTFNHKMDDKSIFRRLNIYNMFLKIIFRILNAYTLTHTGVYRGWVAKLPRNGILLYRLLVKIKKTPRHRLSDESARTCLSLSRMASKPFPNYPHKD